MTLAGPARPGGTVAAIEVAVIAWTAARVPATVTVVPVWKPLPEIVIAIPPEVGPDAGTMLATIGGASANVARTFVSALRVTWHVPVPLHPPPDHPAKTELPVATAVRVTGLPLAKTYEQFAPQEIPAGTDVTSPVPAPASVTDNLSGRPETSSNTVPKPGLPPALLVP